VNGPKAGDSDLFLRAALRVSLADTAIVPDPAMHAAADTVAAWLDDPAHAKTFIPHPALIARGLRALGIALPVASRRRLEAAALREEKRSSIAARQAEQLDELLDGHAVDRHPVRGWHFAGLCYPEPLARHCHALRWLVTEATERSRIVDLLAEAGWSHRLAPLLLSPHKAIFAGQDRINVEIHERPLPWTRRLPDRSSLASSDYMAVELIGSALIEPHARIGLWRVDLVQLLRKRPVDPTSFARLASEFGLAAAADRALDDVGDLVATAEAELTETIDAMRFALRQKADGEPRDAPALADLMMLKSMAESSRKRLLLTALRRPDLFMRSYAMRKDRARQGQRAASERQKLREHHETNRKG
jgi:hypothetical protein